MKRMRSYFVLAICAVSAISIVSATTDEQSKRQKTIEEMARDFNTTPEQLEKWFKRELGEPLVYENETGIMVRRSEDGVINQVTIATPRTLTTVVPSPAEKEQAMSYAAKASSERGNYIDTDGDGSIDWMFFSNANAHPTTLIRLGQGFTPITGGSMINGVEIGEKIYTFDRISGDWIEQKHEVEISRVSCLYLKFHSGEYEAWKIWISRTGLKGEKLNATDITTVGAGPTSLTVAYKLLDSGLMYLSIKELDLFHTIETDGRLSAPISEEDFNAVEVESHILQVNEGMSREIEADSFPTLRQQ